MTITAYKIDPNSLKAQQAAYQAQVGADTPLLPLFIKQTAKVLLNTPKAYLRFGPYWWAVKRILSAAGYGVGSYFEPIWDKEYSQETDELTLLAAWAFGDDAMGRFGVQTREYDLTDDTTFVLYDPDQEQPKP